MAALYRLVWRLNAQTRGFASGNRAKRRGEKPKPSSNSNGPTDQPRRYHRQTIVFSRESS